MTVLKTPDRHWLTTSEAAQLLGVTQSYILHLIYKKRIDARRAGPRCWLVCRDAVSTYQPLHGGRARIGTRRTPR